MSKRRGSRNGLGRWDIWTEKMRALLGGCALWEISVIREWAGTWVVLGLLFLSPALTPVRVSGQSEAGHPTSVGEPISRMVELPSRPAPTGISLQAVATATAVLEEGAKTPTTYTAAVVTPSGSLLDRLTRNKPGIWGNKGFYVGLAVAYVVLLGLFFRLIIQMARQQD